MHTSSELRFCQKFWVYILITPCKATSYAHISVLPLQCPSSPTPKRKFYHGGTEAQRRKKKREFWQICDPLEDEGPPYLPKVYILEDTETTSWQQLASISLCPISLLPPSANVQKMWTKFRFWTDFLNLSLGRP